MGQSGVFAGQEFTILLKSPCFPSHACVPTIDLVDAGYRCSEQALWYGGWRCPIAMQSMTDGPSKCVRSRGGAGQQPVVDTSHAQLRGLGFAALAVVVLTYWMLVYPFDFQAHAVNQWLGNNRIGKLNTLANIALFVPYGVVTAWWWVKRQRCGCRVVVTGVFLGAIVLSLLAETSQVWLPVRASSIVDIVANALGGLLGAFVGCHWAPALTTIGQRLWSWQTDRPALRRSWVLLALAVAVRVAPFDVSPETLYLRLSLQDSWRAGWPMSAVIAWHRDTTGNSQLWEAARVELLRMGANFGLFMVMTAAVSSAVQEQVRRVGDRYHPTGSIIVLAAVVVVITELLQWPVRSRLMDASDAAAGMAGVCFAALWQRAWSNLRKDR